MQQSHHYRAREINSPEHSKLFRLWRGINYGFEDVDYRNIVLCFLYIVNNRFPASGENLCQAPIQWDLEYLGISDPGMPIDFDSYTILKQIGPDRLRKIACRFLEKLQDWFLQESDILEL